jgi:hypothetical protein
MRNPEKDKQQWTGFYARKEKAGKYKLNFPAFYA